MIIVFCNALQNGDKELMKGKQYDSDPRPAFWHDVQHSMTRRNENINYHRGRTAYMLTLKIEEGKQLLSRLPSLCAATRCSIETGSRKEGLMKLLSQAKGCMEGGSMRTDSREEGLMEPLGQAKGYIDAGAAVAARPVLSPLGEAMRKAWLTLPERFPQITIRDRADEWVIMPEHFHGILFINEDMLEHLSDIEKLFKQRVAMAYRKLLVEGAVEPVGQGREWLEAYRALPAAQQAATKGWIERQVAILYSATRCGTQGNSAPFRVCAGGKRKKQGFLFAPSYNDRPFWDEETLANKRHYILNNAINRIRRKSNPEWLKPIRGGVDTALSVKALEGYLRKECAPWQMCAQVWGAIERKLICSATRCRIEGGRIEGGRIEGGRVDGSRVEGGRVEGGIGYRRIDCDTYGNSGLLDRSKYRLLPLVCHRADKALRSKQREAFFEAAKQGAVTVSACINPDENELFKELVAAGYPAIKIEDNGFPEVYHPSEERQVRCAEGRYLIVSPWQYEYRSEDAVLEVAFCKTMNCVAQAISRCRDDWWRC